MEIYLSAQQLADIELLAKTHGKSPAAYVRQVVATQIEVNSELLKIIKRIKEPTEK